MKRLFTILLASSLSACSSWVSVKKVEDGTEKGLRYHLPMTILKIEPSDTGNGEFTIAHEAVADPNQLYAIDTGNFLATNNTVIETKNGLLASVSLDGDATALATKASEAALAINKEKRKAKEAAKTEAKAAADKKKTEQEKAISTWKGEVKSAEDALAVTEREIQVVLDTNIFRQKKINEIKDGKLKSLQDEIIAIQGSSRTEDDQKLAIEPLQSKIDALQLVISTEEAAIEIAERGLISSRSELLAKEQTLADLKAQHADWAPFLVDEVMSQVQVEVIEQAASQRTHHVWGPVYYRLVDNYDPYNPDGGGTVKLVALTYGSGSDTQRSFQSMIPITPANRPPVGPVSATGAGTVTVTPADLKAGVNIAYTQDIERIIPDSITFTSLSTNSKIDTEFLSADVAGNNKKQVVFKCTADELKGKYRLNYRYQVDGSEFLHESFYNIKVATPASVPPPTLGVQGEWKVSCDKLLTTKHEDNFSSKVSLVEGSVKVFPKPNNAPVGRPLDNTIALNIEDGTKLSISWLKKLKTGSYKIAFDLLYKDGSENKSLHQEIAFLVDECSGDS